MTDRQIKMVESVMKELTAVREKITFAAQTAVNEVFNEEELPKDWLDQLRLE